MWLFFGTASILFTLLHAYAVFDKRRGYRWMAFAAFGCTTLTLFSEYRLISRWVAAEDWTALMDVVPYTSAYLTAYTLILLLVNGLIFFFGNKKPSTKYKYNMYYIPNVWSSLSVRVYFLEK